MESEGRAAYQSKYGDLVKSLISGGGGTAPEVPTAPGGEVPPQPDLSQAHPEYLTGGGMPPPSGDMNMANMQNAIASIESAGSGGYSAIGNTTGSGDRAYGKYQVMGENIPVWTRQALGREMTPEQFLADPQAQDQVFNTIFGGYLKEGSPQDAASRWFTGQPLSVGANRADVNGMTGSQYVNRFTGSLGNLAGADSPAGDVSISSYSPSDDATGRPDLQTAGLSIDQEPGLLDQPPQPQDIAPRQLQPQPQPQPGVQQVAANGFDPRLIDALSDPWIPEGQKAVLEELFKQQLKKMEPQDPIKVGEHDKLIDPITHQVIYDGGPSGADAPKITAITALRKDYENQPGTSRYRQSVPVLTSMAAAVNDTTAMADLDFVYGMAQIFDPESVVRESEMGMVIDSQSMPAAIKGRLEKILNGQASLGPQARKDLVEASRRRVQQYRTQAEGEAKQFGGIADRNRINREDIMRPLEDMPELAPAAPPPDTAEDTSQLQEGDAVEDISQLKEGDIIEDDQHRRFKFVDGKLVPVPADPSATVPADPSAMVRQPGETEADFRVRRALAEQAAGGQ
jgi:hypothetical protein